MGTRKAITKAQLDRWNKASKAEKSAILDAVCAVTHWHRDHARKAIRQALAERERGAPTPRKQREPVCVYEPQVIEVLTRCWAAMDGPIGNGCIRRCRTWCPTCAGTVTSMGSRTR